MESWLGSMVYLQKFTSLLLEESQKSYNQQKWRLFRPSCFQWTMVDNKIFLNIFLYYRDFNKIYTINISKNGNITFTVTIPNLKKRFICRLHSIAVLLNDKPFINITPSDKHFTDGQDDFILSTISITDDPTTRNTITPSERPIPPHESTSQRPTNGSS